MNVQMWIGLRNKTVDVVSGSDSIATAVAIAASSSSAVVTPSPPHGLMDGVTSGHRSPPKRRFADQSVHHRKETLRLHIPLCTNQPPLAMGPFAPIEAVALSS